MYLRSQHPGTGPVGRYPTRSRPILTGSRILGMAVVTALRRCANRERENDVLCRANHGTSRAHSRSTATGISSWPCPHQFVNRATRYSVPADLTERLMAVSADRILEPVPRPSAWSRLRVLPVLVELIGGCSGST